jgi:Na+-transporting NADH:ubiquinone oxidoreductase subunit C
VPVYGAGLWGPIWGYLSIDADGKTIYGAYFAHQGETPGLGAEIEKPAFSSRFEGKQLFKDGRFIPIEVVKAGQRPANEEADYVDGVSGGTITSKGVSAMIGNCLTTYKAFFESITTK